ncbi:hypothetical protein ASAP_0356 [Asaia bogorensis]|uniref:Uncharacterized protein n=2 Tax=Asaia bogorensis TaxID=91915 RepID=A0A060QGK6_9PROT|nr:hypothetical protein [Asaia sp. SF2.1]ETC98818.1 hypothetical protein P792_08275 [Asaia sp. SF2.1]CDG38401.1 hypothetical protein ASAP_0356 [Asaia bogorensis]
MAENLAHAPVFLEFFMSTLSFPRIALAFVVLIVLGLGGAFLKLGMNPPLPVQTMVHKDLPGTQFAATTADSAPAMPGAAPAKPMPAMPEPVAAPTLQH